MTELRIQQLMKQIGYPDSQSIRLALETVANEVEQEIWQKVEARTIEEDLNGCIEGSDLMETVSCLDMIAEKTGHRVLLYERKYTRIYPHPDVKL